MMTGYIVYTGLNINYIIDEITVKKPLTHVTNDYIGTGQGSGTEYVSSGGRVLSFKNLCTRMEESPHGRGHRINDYKYVAGRYSKTAGVLTSPSQSKLNGNYIVTGFDYTEDTGNNYVCTWELTEIIPFNVKSRTFRVWGKSTSSNGKAKKTTQKTKNTLSSNTKYLLIKCGTLKKGAQGKCVEALQRFLQSKGYYKGYKIDGDYATYTAKAVKSLQQRYKLKTSSAWDKTTRAYFRKLYKVKNK